MWPTIPLVPCPLSTPPRETSSGPWNVGRNPTALAITNKGTGNISDDIVFVTQIFAELNPDFKDPNSMAMVRPAISGNEGSSRPSRRAMPIRRSPKSTLTPLADSGFNANRVAPFNFCSTAATAQSLIFCPNPDDPTDPINTNNPQGVFPNQLLSAVIRGNRLYLPNIGAQPEPPEVFNVNVQALVNAVDTYALAEVTA